MVDNSNVINLFDRTIRKHNFMPRLEEHLISGNMDNTKRISMKHFTSTKEIGEMTSRIYGKSHSLEIHSMDYTKNSANGRLVTDFATVLCDEDEKPLFQDEELVAQILLAQIRHFERKCKENGYKPIFISESGFLFYFQNGSAIIPFGEEYVECDLHDGELERQRAGAANSDYIIIDEKGIQNFSS